MGQVNRRQFLSGGIVLVGAGALGATGGGHAIAATQPGEPAIPAGTAAGHLVTGDTGIDSGWTFQPAYSTTATGETLSTLRGGTGMRRAVVPGTALTSMIANGQYPDPLYRHIVTDTVPDTLKDTDYWYRAVFEVPRSITGQRFWLQFDGVNYLAGIWLNGTEVGTIEGAFVRGIFDVTPILADVKGNACLAVRVGRLDYSEGPSRPSYVSGVTRGGRNGGPTGITLENGPTFFCTAGWDWLPTIPDRDLGIWQPVTWSTTGPVRLSDVRVDPTLSEDLHIADIAVDLTLDSAATATRTVVVTGNLDGRDFRQTVSIPVGSSSIRLTSAQLPLLRLTNPALWWPNGYGDPHRYTLMVQIEADGMISDERTVPFGVRRIEYTMPLVQTDFTGASTIVESMAITVNNQPILVMGGNWGMDEALKRIPRERLFEQVRMHRDANLNLIRNWTGQSTTEDLFDACDEYGILVWQEFFSSTEGPGAVNSTRYLNNVRDCILRYRNHPSILLWCGGNEGSPPQELVDGLAALAAELDPKRACLTCSAFDTGADPIEGYTSGGPYQWVTPATHFAQSDGEQWPPFHNEVGSYSIPSLEFIRKMIPESSWENPDDFWADRDVNGNGGNGGGAGYIALTGQRYGDVQNLPDFARKSQLMNYECVKAIFEAPAAAMLGIEPGRPYPRTGVIMWMSNPAQPSFVWQMYSHDLEAHSSYYAVQHACRRVNVILNSATYDVVVANHTSNTVRGTVAVTCYGLDGTPFGAVSLPVDGAAPANHTVIGNVAAQLGAAPTGIAFVHLSFNDTSHVELVRNFYWIEKPGTNPGFADLDTLAPAAISVTAQARSTGGAGQELIVQVGNTGTAVALMIHLQVHDTVTGERILPATFSDNYLNLVRGESATVRVQLAARARNVGIRIDGWKLDQRSCSLRGNGVRVSFNQPALAVDPPTKTFSA